MHVFPGFSYPEVRDMDLRDYEFWVREAHRKETLDKMKLAHAVALGSGNLKDGTTQMKTMQEDVEKAHADMEKFYDDKWQRPQPS